MVLRFFDFVAPYVGTALISFGMVLLVAATAALGKIRSRNGRIAFPPPLGVRLIVWAMLAIWTLLILAPLDLGMYWLAALFALGPAFTLWRWPETIAIDQMQIYQSAWCHREISILWQNIVAIELSGTGDSLVLRGRNGERIGISSSQVGAEILREQLTARTGLRCPDWQTSI